MQYIKRYLRPVVCLMLACALFLMPFASAESFSAYVKAKSAVIYSNAWLSKRIGSLTNKTVVTVLDYSNGVAHISYQGRTGYARVKDLATVASIATVVETTCETRVYSKPTYASSYVTVEKGLRMNMLMKVNSICAMVERNGNVGYVHISDIKAVAASSDSGKTESPQTSGGVTYENFRARVTADSASVYSAAKTSSKKLGEVAKGTIVNVSAYNKEGWAFIELNGRKGYAKVSNFQRIKESGGYFADASLSNEQKIYKFITQEMGLNSAAACGIIANIKYESGFKTGSIGDNGRSYGICQWFSARWDRLNSFCEKNAYDAATLEGQLRFMAYELEKHYPLVLKYLKNSVSNNAQGAYDAAWFFCYHYEGPANRSSVSATRASYAKKTVWERYH